MEFIVTDNTITWLHSATGDQFPGKGKAFWKGNSATLWPHVKVFTQEGDVLKKKMSQPLIMTPMVITIIIIIVIGREIKIKL